MRLVKCLRESASVNDNRNTIVIVASQLAAIPEWIHKDNPFLEIIQVHRPRQHERRVFLERYCERFHGGAGIASDQMKTLTQDFANLTDGFTAQDLWAVLRTSVAEQISIREPCVLVDYFKYGLREDPWESLDVERIQSAGRQLQQRVIGQENAVRSVETMLVSAKVGVTMSGDSSVGGKPKGVFFFVGPTGVGKTELSKALTELIFSDESAFARFDMSEYSEKHAAEKLTGAPLDSSAMKKGDCSPTVCATPVQPVAVRRNRKGAWLDHGQVLANPRRRPAHRW